MIYITGPGHGGPGLVANTYLEGTYSEVYPNISQDEEGMKTLFKQFSFPGGIPSHVAPETPGSIHEGGELGYALVARLRRGLRQSRPDRRLRRRRRRSGDRPARDELALEQVPQPGARRRGAADPAPQRLQDRQPHRPRAHQPRGAGPALPRLRLHAAISSKAASRPTMHQLMAATLDAVVDEIQRIKADARRNGIAERPRWPMIVLRTPKGWTCPKEIDGKRDRGLLALAPGADGRDAREPGARAASSKQWMKSYRPEELFDDERPASSPSWPSSRPRASAA